MIEIKGCSKAFGKVQAVRDVSLSMGEREVFGLVGSNGAGKSTILRMAAGILRPDGGSILVDNEAVYENEKIKEKIFYISDDSYVPQNYTVSDMAEFYRNYYPTFRMERFYKLVKQFHLDEKRKGAYLFQRSKKTAFCNSGHQRGNEIPPVR